MNCKLYGISSSLLKERWRKARAGAKAPLDDAKPQPKVHFYELSYRFIAYLIGLLLAFESMLLFA